jgi:two-component system nitrogen regulation sensor histidine kinase NtrY
MVTEFSSFARIPEIMPRMNDLAALAREVVQVFQNSHRTISWNLAGTEQPCIIPFDQEALRRALMNLLLNAAEILEDQDGGRVDMALHANQEQNQVSILIQDNGPGLTPEERTHMFEPYYSRKRGGTGLGLTIVKSIVNDHRGNILVRSRQPCGTCFEIILPASQPMSA